MVGSADVTLGRLLAIGVDRDCDKPYAFRFYGVAHLSAHLLCRPACWCRSVGGPRDWSARSFLFGKPCGFVLGIGRGIGGGTCQRHLTWIVQIATSVFC